VAEFDGLSGSLKRSKVLTACGLKRARLSQLVVGGGFDSGGISSLLSAMQSNTRPVTPKRLGTIGEDHFRQRFLALGCVPESIRYSRRLAKDGLPYVVEMAFAKLSDGEPRVIYAAANWSSAINNPFRTFGSTGEGLESVLANARAGGDEPIVLAVHLTHPRVEYTDRGKSAMVIGQDVTEGKR